LTHQVFSKLQSGTWKSNGSTAQSSLKPESRSFSIQYYLNPIFSKEEILQSSLRDILLQIQKQASAKPTWGTNPTKWSSTASTTYGSSYSSQASTSPTSIARYIWCLAAFKGSREAMLLMTNEPGINSTQQIILSILRKSSNKGAQNSLLSLSLALSRNIPTESNRIFSSLVQSGYPHATYLAGCSFFKSQIHCPYTVSTLAEAQQLIQYSIENGPAPLLNSIIKSYSNDPLDFNETHEEIIRLNSLLPLRNDDPFAEIIRFPSVPAPVFLRLSFPEKIQQRHPKVEEGIQFLRLDKKDPNNKTNALNSFRIAAKAGDVDGLYFYGTLLFWHECNFDFTQKDTANKRHLKYLKRTIQKGSYEVLYFYRIIKQLNDECVNSKFEQTLRKQNQFTQNNLHPDEMMKSNDRYWLKAFKKQLQEEYHNEESEQLMKITIFFLKEKIHSATESDYTLVCPGPYWK
jgi:hypothetical protein